MMLAMLIRKDGLAHIASANPAKVANQESEKTQPLARLATLALAPVQNSFDAEALERKATTLKPSEIPPTWADEYDLLRAMCRPSGYVKYRWEQLLNDAGAFVEKWGSQASVLGWQLTDVFGVCPDAPEVRLDCMGLVPLLQGRKVCALTRDTARIDCGGGRTTTFTRKTMSASAVMPWTLKNGFLVKTKT